MDSASSISSKSSTSDNSITTLNPTLFYPRFSHISEQIFVHLDNESLKNCRKVSKTWQECIDDTNVFWNKFVKNKDYNKSFQSSCKNGHSNIAKMLLQKSAKIEIELNAKDRYGLTAFHLACRNGHSKIVEILIQASPEFNIELNAKDRYGWTAFHWACRNGRTSIVDMMINNYESLKLDLTAKNDFGQTGFQLAQVSGWTDVVNVIRTKMAQIAF